MRKFPVIFISFLVLLLVFYLCFSIYWKLIICLIIDIQFLSGSDQKNQPTPFQPFLPDRHSNICWTLPLKMHWFRVLVTRHLRDKSISFSWVQIIVPTRVPERMLFYWFQSFTKENKVSLLSFPRDL